MTRAFLWFVMIATLGNAGCGDVEVRDGGAYEASLSEGLSETWGDDAGDKALVAPFHAKPGHHIFTNIDLGHGDTLTAVSVFITPEPHAAMPDVMPEVLLWKSEITTGIGTEIGHAEDDASSVGEYNKPHSIEVSGLNETFDSTLYTYLIQFNQGSGDYALTGKVNGALITYAPACN